MQNDIIDVNKHFLNSGKLIKSSLPPLRTPIIKAAMLITKCLKDGGKLLICGNGGSAAEAQHFSSELSGRYLRKRKALAAIALTVDTSAITAIRNDYGFYKVFSRQVEAIAKSEDLLFCISTSGNSTNLIAAAKTANKLAINTIALSGGKGGKLKHVCDVNLIVPAANTPFIHEVHLIVIHTICDLIESAL